MLHSPTGTSFTGSAPRSSALQTRVANVLSASYADLDIRDALAILDARTTGNTPESRRNLRLDVQEELIQCNGNIVRDFGRVTQQLTHVGVAIADLKSSCADMRRHIVASDRDTAPILEEANAIMSDEFHVEVKEKLLDAFAAHFVISDADYATLTSTAEPVNDNFFRILTRAKKIHEDTQVLLRSENQRLGLEVLEQSSKQLDAAFQKLYRWIQREFKTLDLENPHISVAIRRALRVLAERPTLFQNCLDFFASARENVLSSNFYASLTGAPVDPHHPVMGKAIELSAYDPLRYVGDMLAWAHSATVSEREALEALFISDGDDIARSIQAGLESEPWSRSDDGDLPAFDGRETLSDVVNKDLAGVFRQLKQRIEQVILSHEDAVLAYRISNLISFYCNVFSSLLDDHCSLLEILRPLSDTAMRSFASTMHDHIAKLHADLYVSEDDLSPPEFLIEALEILQTLMKSYDTSAASADRAQRIEGFQPILQQALDPYLSGCENVARRLRSPSNHIFSLNCLVATKDVLRRFPFADRTDELQPKIVKHVDGLVGAIHDLFLHESTLVELVNKITTIDDLAVSYKEPDRLASVAQNLDGFLPTAIEDARRSLAQLEDRTVVTKVIESAAERFCEDFEEIEDLVLRADEKRLDLVNGGLDEAGKGDMLMLRHVFPRTGDEIRVLLS